MEKTQRSQQIAEKYAPSLYPVEQGRRGRRETFGQAGQEENLTGASETNSEVVYLKRNQYNAES